MFLLVESGDNDSEEEGSGQGMFEDKHLLSKV